MQTTDAIDAPVPLNKPHWVPGHVQINDIAALLKVYALGQHVRRDEDVVEVSVAPRWRLSRYWCETVDRFLPFDFF